ncbi:TPA: aldolase [Enterobacter hormaechei subsp. xiangfangensis]|nr:aldolase [Enterobacter hormaechei subsp. xiangfangensis]
MFKSSSLSKEEIVKKSLRSMEDHLPKDKRTQKQKLAIACRILFSMGHDSGLAGQITARGEEPGTWYTQQLGLGFDEITASNLLLVDDDLNILAGEGMANPANRFHAWIYHQRPDINCIIHTHPIYASTLSMLGTPLIVSHMDTCPLYNDCAFLEKWPGIPVGNEEGIIISEALGTKKTILLAHHGQISTGSTIEEACNLAILLERAAKMQLLAMPAGEIQPLDEHLAHEAHEWIARPVRHHAAFEYYARRVLNTHSDCID